MIRVLLADDDALVRTGLRVLLEAEPDVTVAGEAATGREAVDAARRHQPDVVLMDVRMPDRDGVWATAQIVSWPPPRPRVLVLTTFDLDQVVEDTGPMVIREKEHTAAPITLDQALYEMELVGHDFYLFVDKESGRPSVVYRRRAYDYGVIRLEVADG